MTAFDAGVLILRVVFGLFVAAHGYNKFFGPNGIAGTTGWFASMGMRHAPMQARMAATTEIVAGVLFAIGLLTPLAAAGIIGIMTVAYWTSHRTVGFFVFRPGQGWEYVAAIGAAAFSVAVMGAGQASVDHALGYDTDVDGWIGAAFGVLGVLVGILQLALFYRPAKEPAA